MKGIIIKKIKSSEAPFELLLLADPSREAVNKYLKKGSCFAAIERNEIVGVYVLTSKSVFVQKSEVLFKEPLAVNGKKIHLSDHFGVYAELQV